MDHSGFSFRWVAIFFVLFLGVIDVCALTFQYVEGDDARSVAYALLGTGTDLYEPMHYHSMSLLLLSLLPKQEEVVRVAAIACSAIGAVTYLILVARVAWHWARSQSLPTAVIVVGLVILPLMIPDFAFLGLAFEPVLVGMSIVLAGHLITRTAFVTGAGYGWRALLGAVLFGLGVSFRWDVGFYGSVIAMDLLIAGWDRHKPLVLFCKVGVWGVAALLAMVGALALAGYSPAAIVETYHWTKLTVAMAPPMLERLVDGVAFLTPAMLLLTVAGLIAVGTALRKKWRVLALLLSSAPLFVVVGNPSFCAKAFLTAMPALILLMLQGVDWLWRFSCERNAWMKCSIRSLFLLCLLVPWLVGVQWKRADTVRGPGFEIGKVGSDSSGSPRLAFAGGLSAPTPEGPRPLWGFAYVLFGGEWRHFVQTMNEQWNTAVDLAIDRKLPLHQDSDTAIAMCGLMARGFELRTDRAPVANENAPDYAFHRLYKDSHSDRELEVILFSGMDERLKDGAVAADFSRMGYDEMIIVYAIPSRMHRLHHENRDTVTLLSPFTGIWRRSRADREP